MVYGGRRMGKEMGVFVWEAKESGWLLDEDHVHLFELWGIQQHSGSGTGSNRLSVLTSHNAAWH